MSNYYLIWPNLRFIKKNKEVVPIKATSNVIYKVKVTMIKKRIFKISASIASKILSVNNFADNKQIDGWLNEKTANKELLNKLSNLEFRASYNRDIQKFDANEAWENIEYKLLTTNNRKSIPFKFYKYAAVAMLVLSLGISTHYLINNSSLFVKESTISLISSKASLTLANGDIIDLTKDTSCVNKLFNIVVDGKTETIIYNTNLQEIAAQKINATEFNTISTDIGKDFRIVLPEGTIAHLNSGSSLKFPSIFTNDKREVEVSGEVLFDVQEDKSKPFIVKTKNMRIEVLGTTFNVNSYEDNDAVYTTLLSGSLRVSDANNSVIISPSQQAVYNKENSSITVKEVDTEVYSSWAHGGFVFKDETLVNIVKSINRWYDFDYIFRDVQSKEIRIGMNINREENFDKIYETLKNSGLFNLEKRGKTLIFSKK